MFVVKSIEMLVSGFVRLWLTVYWLEKVIRRILVKGIKIYNCMRINFLQIQYMSVELLYITVGQLNCCTLLYVSCPALR